MQRTVPPLWVVVTIVAVLAGLGALWHFWLGQPRGGVTPEQAYQIQREVLEGLARAAPRNPTPGKYEAPPGFPMDGATGR